ncbi:unnamed protein product [Adineta ricciae]|uniref:Uncharacterized protein n=1 Tax=Adineta ricciae TaxID=249248 RepID=A0A814H170_ADIRI|nr:unnamed protein product [Adineta ricciae]CAF1510484.1 unnamed protein product [Adineta ricciae]
MPDDPQWFESYNDSSLFDTYLVYALIGTLLFIAFIGVLVLLATSYCCLYSYFCCYRRHRHSSYQLNDKVQEHENREKISCLQLYDTYPYLVNQCPLEKQNFNTSYTTINTIGNPSIPRTPSLHTVPPEQQYDVSISYKPSAHVGVTAVKDHVRTTNTCFQVSCWPTPLNHFNTTHEVDQNNLRTSPCANIYETVVPITADTAPVDRATPIYEAEWTHNLKQLIMTRMPSFELPSLSSGITATTDYFQQPHPYNKVLAARAKASDSMRRNKMLKRLKDDTAFLY